MNPWRWRLCLVASVSSACSLSACSSWRAQSITPQRVITERQPTAAWVTRGNRRSVLLERPEIRRDSIVGWGRSAGIVAIPLAEVTRISIREPDGGKTAGLVLGITAAVGGGLYFVILSALSGG